MGSSSRSSSRPGSGTSSRRLTHETLDRGTRHLRRTDPRLGAWIDRIGRVDLRRHNHQFGALCRAIVSQQLAAKAAATIYRRFLELLATRYPKPREVLAQSESDLRACGLSTQKIRYLRALAEEFDDGSLRNVRLSDLSDEDVVRRLTVVPGVGVWTAEMFLIFSLGRLDVFSVGDLALRAGVERVESSGSLTHEEILAVSERWSPYRSVASLYLWKIAHWRDDD